MGFLLLWVGPGRKSLSVRAAALVPLGDARRDRTQPGDHLAHLVVRKRVVPANPSRALSSSCFSVLSKGGAPPSTADACLLRQRRYFGMAT